MMTQPNDFQFYFLLLLPRESPEAAQTDFQLPSVAQASSETYTKETLLSIKLFFSRLSRFKWRLSRISETAAAHGLWRRLRALELSDGRPLLHTQSVPTVFDWIVPPLPRQY